MQIRTRNNMLGYKMASPSVLLILCISIYPLLNGIFLSFQSYYLLRPNKYRGFIGIENYKNLLTNDSEFTSALLYTFIYALCVVSIAFFIGLLLALLLNRDIKGRTVYRALILLPWVISPAIASINWLWVLNDRIGFINIVLTKLGIISEPILFLAISSNARITVIFTGIWKAFPFLTISILAGMQSISSDLYEAAHIDGAGFWKALYYITMPHIKNISLVATILMFIWNFNNFENIYLLTTGGPANATFTLPILTYYTAFFRSNLGYASAIATIMLVVLLFFAMIYLRALRMRNSGIK